SKGAVQAAALGFAAEHRGHALLFVLPLAASGLTAFALFRLWFLAFAGAPRDTRVVEHAAESTPLAAPLVVLAVLAGAVAWPGWATAAACRALDGYVLDGAGLLLARGWRRLARWAGRFDRKVVGGLADGAGAAVSRAGAAAGAVQTGSLRGSALWLV